MAFQWEEVYGIWSLTLGREIYVSQSRQAITNV